MKVFKGMGWVKELLDKSRQKLSKGQPQNLTGPTEAVTDLALPEQENTIPLSAYQKILLNKRSLIKTVSTLGVVTAVVWSGNIYVKNNMAEIVRVSVNGQEVGVVKDKSLVEQYVASKTKELENSSSDIRLEVKAPEVDFASDRAFKPKTNEQEVLDKVSSSIVAQPVGVELLVDGKPMGVLKDEATADQLLQQIKTSAVDKKKEPGTVQILSASPAPPAGQTELQKVDFVQKVELKEIPIQPQDVVNPEELRKKLETGNVQPFKYTVEKGDCVSCIAKKLNIPKQVIYQNNPWIQDDMIKAGQQLDLTVLQPALAVRTVEKVTEPEEIQFDTEYQQDNSMRVGTDETIQAGQNGVKNVIIQVTKVNGFVIEESVQNEEIVRAPVKAIVRKGTKVVQGEGTGKFAWPVASSTISSTFGTRWGVWHKGIDLVSSNKAIMAADNGKVISAGNKNDGYGNSIIIDHLNGYKTLYGHLSAINVTVGQIVEKGENIGVMGSTGDSTGVHLHFEVRVNDVPENPLKYINK